MSQGEHWTETKARADRADPAIRRILAEVFETRPEDWSAASADLDMYECTDYVCSVRPGLRVGARWRQEFYLCTAYENDVTIRKDRPSGNASQWEKLQRGHGTHDLYFFVDMTGAGIRQWVLLDLREMRRHEDWGVWVKEEKANPDGSSTFVALDLRRMPKACIAATSDNHPVYQPAEPSPPVGFMRRLLLSRGPT